MNFILLNYKHQFSNQRMIKYYALNQKFNELIIKRINHLYDDCTIHVLTDHAEKDRDNIKYHHLPDLEKNHFAKLQIYGLLSEPAMFLDNDIILIKRFGEKHMQANGPFNVFRQYDDISYKILPSHIRKHTHYNTGVIWVAKPSKDLVNELTALGNDLRYSNGWDDKWVNDEYVLSRFIIKHNIKIIEMDEVNKYRSDIALAADILNYQSIHYRQKKELLIRDYSYIGVKHA